MLVWNGVESEATDLLCVA